MLTSANGARLGAVYRVGPDGAAQIIIDGKLVTVPANTISVANGKLVTSLTKSCKFSRYVEFLSTKAKTALLNASLASPATM